MRGILVRIGIDASAGGWNAPVDPHTGKFVYVPIPETIQNSRDGYQRTYEEILPALEEFGVSLPPHLSGLPMHLDPDFSYLSYGDCYPRNIPLHSCKSGDFLVFYAGLKPVVPGFRGLVYALVGFFLIDEIVPSLAVPPEKWHENAHTRRRPDAMDLIVRAVPEKSGRFTHCIPIGEYRNRAYRVKESVLREWGGLTVKDGYLQRSGRLPGFREPDRFLDWLSERSPVLTRTNF